MDTTKCWCRYRITGILKHCRQECILLQPLWKVSAEFGSIHKAEHMCALKPSDSTSRHTCTYRGTDIFMHMLIDALALIAKNWKWLTSAWATERETHLKIYKMEFHTAAKKNTRATCKHRVAAALTDTMLNQKKLEEKKTVRVAWFHFYRNYEQAALTYSDRGQRSGRRLLLSGGRMWRGRRMVFRVLLVFDILFWVVVMQMCSPCKSVLNYLYKIVYVSICLSCLENQSIGQSKQDGVKRMESWYSTNTPIVQQ